MEKLPEKETGNDFPNRCRFFFEKREKREKRECVS